MWTLEGLRGADPVLGLALLLVLAVVLADWLHRHARLPRPCGYMLVGALASPLLLSLLDRQELDAWKPLIDLAIGVLVFELGARTPGAPAGAGAKLLAAAEPYLGGWQPKSAPAPVAWGGLRPATADGLPLIGAVPGGEGLYVAAGHTMLGVTLAPATAAALAPLVLRDERVPELAPFDPGRAP